MPELLPPELPPLELLLPAPPPLELLPLPPELALPELLPPGITPPEPLAAPPLDPPELELEPLELEPLELELPAEPPAPASLLLPCVPPQAASRLAAQSETATRLLKFIPLRPRPVWIGGSRASVDPPIADLRPAPCAEPAAPGALSG